MRTCMMPFVVYANLATPVNNINHGFMYKLNAKDHLSAYTAVDKVNYGITFKQYVYVAAKH